jgi:hypothetical protein
MTRSVFAKAVLFVGVCVSCPGFAAVAQAQTVSYAESADRLAAACGKDIDEYCRGVNLGGGRMKNCLSQNRDSLSADCKESYTQIFSLIDKRAQARAAVAKLCDVEVRKLCQGTAGGAQILECLLSATGPVSRRCSQAITDAAYR